MKSNIPSAKKARIVKLIDLAQSGPHGLNQTETITLLLSFIASLDVTNDQIKELATEIEVGRSLTKVCVS